MPATTMAVDLAKSVFQIAVTNDNWIVIESRRLTRSQFERWFQNREVGPVVMEACGSGQNEPTFDAGYTTACASKKPGLSIRFLAFRGSPYRIVSRIGKERR